MELTSEENSKCTLGILEREEGSAYLAQFCSSVSVIVEGPHECKASKCMYDRCTVDLTFRRKTGSITVHDKMLEGIMRETCEKAIMVEQYPRTSVALIVQELQDKGNMLAVCLNTACIALVDSGIAMRHLFAAVSCAVMDSDEIIVNPNKNEINSSVAYFTLVFDNSDTRRLLTSHTTGQFSHSTYLHCMDKCYAATKLVFRFYKSVLTNSPIFN